MARRKREPMSEGKKNIIGMLLENTTSSLQRILRMPSKTFLEGRSRKCLSPKWTNIWDIRMELSRNVQSGNTQNLG